MGKYRDHMRRSLGLKICEKLEIKIDETYHVASCCCPYYVHEVKDVTWHTRWAWITFALAWPDCSHNQAVSGKEQNMDPWSLDPLHKPGSRTGSIKMSTGSVDPPSWAGSMDPLFLLPPKLEVTEDYECVQLLYMNSCLLMKLLTLWTAENWQTKSLPPSET